MYAASPGPVDGGFLVGVQIVRLRYTNLRYDECGSVLLQRSSVPVVRRCHTASRLRMVDSWSGKYHSHTHTLSPRAMPEREVYQLYSCSVQSTATLARFQVCVSFPRILTGPPPPPKVHHTAGANNTVPHRSGVRCRHRHGPRPDP